MHGGLTMAQNVETAAHASMPGSAAAAGFVDLVLDVDKMPQALMNYGANLNRINGGQPIQANSADQFARIYELLHEHQGHDFSKYKQNTFARRVQRRMQVLQLADVGAYVERLEGDGNELNHLFRDLLIGVTRFFRDPAAFEALARDVIPALVEDKIAGERIRVWVPGCGSGEEAYSIGILLLEELQKRQHPLEAQIFATDINESALTSARSGLYPAAALADVPRERIERFFVRENGLYRVAKSLRAMCMFALQSVVADPPFSRLDLISCRNLLIYLGPELQARLLPMFHYALREDGFLFLGSAETVGRHSRLFSPVDRKYRIFRRRIARLATRPTFPADAFTRRTRELRQPPEARAEPSPAQWAEGVVLQHYAPAYFVIDEHFDVIQFSAQLWPFLDPVAGSATLNVFGLIHPELRMDLRAALQKARKDRASVTQEAIRLHHDGERRLVDLVVEPRETPNGEFGLYLVILRERSAGIESSQASDATAVSEASVEQLEYELGATRERLQTSIEQLETLNEELSSSNEELLTTNEELQSSNEELEASQEELQSLNEELETVNSELRDKLDELDRTNNDLLNLFENTAIATLFLDLELRIKRFTPGLVDVIAVQQGDEGRLVGDFALRFEYPGLLDDVRSAIRDGTTQEVEIVRREDGRVFMLRIAPYRTPEQTIEGAVLTFVDISPMKEAEKELQTYRKRAEVAIAACGRRPLRAQRATRSGYLLQRTLE